MRGRDYRDAVKSGQAGPRKYQGAGGSPDLSVMFYNVGGLTDLKMLEVIRRTKNNMPDVIMLLDARIAAAEDVHLKHLLRREAEKSGLRHFLLLLKVFPNFREWEVLWLYLVRGSGV